MNLNHSSALWSELDQLFRKFRRFEFSRLFLSHEIDESGLYFCFYLQLLSRAGNTRSRKTESGKDPWDRLTRFQKFREVQSQQPGRDEAGTNLGSDLNGRTLWKRPSVWKHKACAVWTRTFYVVVLPKYLPKGCVITTGSCLSEVNTWWRRPWKGRIMNAISVLSSAAWRYYFQLRSSVPLGFLRENLI